MKWQYELLKNAEAQTNDNTTFKCELPTDGHIAQIDVVISCTNGATSNAGYSNGGTAGERIEDTIDRVQIVANSSDDYVNITAIEDLIAEAIKISGKVPARTISEALSAVQTLYIPIYCGRYFKDQNVVIPNGEVGKLKTYHDKLELKIQYSPTIAATAFATGTFTVSVGVLKLVDGSNPLTKFVKIFKKKEDYTTLASGDKDFKLTYGKNILYRAVQIHCYEAGIEEGVDLTNLNLKFNEKGKGVTTQRSTTWKLQQYINAQDYQLSELNFAGRALCSDTDVISTHVPSPENFLVRSELYTLADTLNLQTRVESRAGDQLTLGSWNMAGTSAVGAAYTTDHAVNWTAKANVIPRYVYFDFDVERTSTDLLDAGNITDFVLWATNGGAGGTVRINEEYIMKAGDFRNAG